MLSYIGSCFLSGPAYCRAGTVIGRCVAIDVVRSTLRSPTSKRDWALQSRRRHRSLCNSAAIKGFVNSTSGLRLQLDILYYTSMAGKIVTYYNVKSNIIFTYGPVLKSLVFNVNSIKYINFTKYFTAIHKIFYVIINTCNMWSLVSKISNNINTHICCHSYLYIFSVCRIWLLQHLDHKCTSRSSFHVRGKTFFCPSRHPAPPLGSIQSPIQLI